MNSTESSPPARVALVARGANVAGGEVSLLSLAHNLPPRYQPVMWVTEPGELAERAREGGLEVCVGRWAMLDRRRPGAMLGLVRELVGQLRRRGVSLIHVNSPVEAMPFLLAARLTRRPALVHVRIEYPRSFLWRQGLALADAVIFNSRALRQAVGWHGAEVVFNGVDPIAPLDAEARIRLRRELGAGEEDFLLGQVGQLIPMKGVDLSLEALARLGERGVAARLVVIGADHQTAGDYGEQMRSLAQQLGLGAQIRFAGYRRDAARCIGALDALLCPSRAEPFGRVLIEAMALGVPVVAARVGGIPEVVRDGLDGLLVEPESAIALADAVEQLRADPAAARRRAESGRERARTEFSARGHAHRVASLYDRVAAPYMGSSRSDEDESEESEA